MKNIYLVLIAIAVMAMSCKTKSGEPGPAGESSLTKQGAISGTLSYVDNDGKTLKESFTYEYYETLTDLYFTDDDGYTISFSRRDLKDYEKKFEFRLYGYFDQTDNASTPVEGRINLSYLSVKNNNLFSFRDRGPQGEFINFNEDAEPTTCVISNFSFNPETGRLVFDYEVNYDPSNINYEDKYDDTTPATVDGHVDVVIAYQKPQPR